MCGFRLIASSRSPRQLHLMNPIGVDVLRDFPIENAQGVVDGVEDEVRLFEGEKESRFELQDGFVEGREDCPYAAVLQELAEPHGGLVFPLEFQSRDGAVVADLGQRRVLLEQLGESLGVEHVERLDVLNRLSPAGNFDGF